MRYAIKRGLDVADWYRRAPTIGGSHRSTDAVVVVPSIHCSVRAPSGTGRDPLMNLKRILLAASVASSCSSAPPRSRTPPRSATPVCIQRSDRPGPQGRLRDTVERPTFDRLHGWISRHPRLADRAAAAAAAGDPIVVRTWIHVIREDLTVAGGNIPRPWIDDQIDVMNDSFGGATGGADTGFGSSSPASRARPTRTGSTCTARDRTGR